MSIYNVDGLRLPLIAVDCLSLIDVFGPCCDHTRVTPLAVGNSSASTSQPPMVSAASALMTQRGARRGWRRCLRSVRRLERPMHPY